MSLVAHEQTNPFEQEQLYTFWSKVTLFCARTTISVVDLRTSDMPAGEHTKSKFGGANII